MVLHWLAFTLKVLLEKKRKYNLETHFLFLDYEKAFNEVRPRYLAFYKPERILIPYSNYKAIWKQHKNKTKYHIDTINKN